MSASDRFAARCSRLLRRFKSSEIDALLVTSPVNVRYLTGFTGEDSYLVIGPQLTILVSDSRFETQISEECPDIEAHIRPRTKTIVEAVSSVVGAARFSRLGFESETTPYARWETLANSLKPVSLVPRAGLVEELRIIKEPSEVDEIREAIRQAERGFGLLRASLRVNMKETEAAHELEHAMRGFGARQASFEIIVAAGPRAALPHARPGDGTLGDSDFVLVDWGATNRRGYRSDLTRVVATGSISPKLRKLYGVVLNAHRRGVEAVKPGVAASVVDSAARRVIAEAGLGKRFGHGLGHGIGLEIHEAPRVSQNSNTELKPGMVITIEPGVYVPGWGGIRIEDDVLVTRSGHEVLSSLSRDLEEIILG